MNKWLILTKNAALQIYQENYFFSFIN